MRSGLSAGSGSTSYTSSAAPPSRPSCSAATRAASSTSGPREVLTSSAAGFIAASSAAPTTPRDRSDSTRCRVTTSDAREQLCLATGSTPAARAASASRCWLQAITDMPNAWPTAATRLPSRPSPTTPSVAPSRSVPSPSCQPPSRRWRSSAGMPLASASSSAQVCSTVGAVSAAGAADDDPALPRGLDVDRDVLPAGGDQQPQVGQPRQQRPREGGPLAHRDHDRRAGQQPDQRVLVADVLRHADQVEVRPEPVPGPDLRGDLLVVVQDDHPQRLRQRARPAARGRRTGRP